MLISNVSLPVFVAEFIMTATHELALSIIIITEDVLSIKQLGYYACSDWSKCYGLLCP